MHLQEKIFKAAFSVLLSAAALAWSSLFVDNTSWYQSLQKPQLAPPPIIFSIVWIVLYALFAASFALIIICGHPTKRIYKLYFITVLLNTLWTYSFFYRQSATGAMFVLGIIIFFALRLLVNVYSVHRTAAYLLIPFIIWVVFALYLNYELIFLN